MFSSKLKSKILSPVNVDGVSKGFKINPQSKRSPSKITSKTLKKVVMPKAILRILKDIEDQDIFSKKLYHTEQWFFIIKLYFLLEFSYLPLSKSLN